MTFQRIIASRRRGEDGAALPLALMFLMLFAVVIGLVFSYIHTGMAANQKLGIERNDLFAVSGGIDAAINQVRNDGTLGTSTSTSSCGTTGVAANGVSVNVACVADTGSGTPIPTTAAPAFAILSTAPYQGPAPTSGCKNISDEVGIAQVQDSKLLTITGNVYVNSDVDSDVWLGGCPQTTTAQHIQVTGNAIVRSSCHDLDVVAGYTDACPLATPSSAQAASLADPGIAEPNSWALPFSTPPAVQAVPTCPAGNVVAFNPGTYTDAAALSTLMNGVSCPGRVFWFKPGQYYFNFTNTGTHEWSINDGRAKVIAGQPTAVTTGGTSIGPTRWAAQTTASVGFSGNGAAAAQIDGTTSDVQLGNITATTGPTTWNATGASSTTFANPGNAVAIDGATADGVLSGGSTTGTLTATTFTNGQPGGNAGFNTNPDNARVINGTSAAAATFTAGTRSITLQNYAGTGAPVPAGATITGVSLQVAHNEGATSAARALVNNPTVTVTPGGAASCGALTVTKSSANNANPITQTFADVMTNCLNTPAKVNGATVAYAVAHTGSGTATPTIDGITLTVTYTTGTSSGAVTVTGFNGGAAIPAGATINTITMNVAHNEGSTTAATVNVPTVTLPGCTTNLTRRSTLGTETVTLAGGCLSVAQLNAGPSLTFNASIPAGSPGTTVNLDGITLAVTYTVTTAGTSGTATVTLSGYATSPVTNIPDDATITSVRLRVAHGEDTPSLVGNPSVVLTPANSAACPTVNIAKRATVGEDAAPSYDVTSCFTLPAQINNGVSLQYRLAHCTGSANGCVASTGTKAHLDGIWLDVTYVSNPRLPWDPNDPTANPNVPGACRHDGDPFWTDGVQWVFGGDSRINLMSGQMELCDKPSLRHTDPSLDQQEIVLYGVKPAATQTNSWAAGTVAPTNTTTPCPTTIASGSSSTSFCQSASVQAIDATTASVLFATAATVSKAVTLTNWSGTAIPPGSTITSVTARVAHRETSNTIPVTISGSAGGGCTISSTTVPPNVTGNLSSGTLRTDFVSLPACVNANLASLSLAFNANYTCASSCPTIANPAGSILDGITLDISYTPSSTGGLNPQSGCIVQTPYYNPTDHSPAYNGACALIKITRPPLSQTPPPGDIRKLTLWGTAYAPASAFDLPVDLLPVPVFNRGVVARMLMLGYQVANSTQVPFTTVPLAGSTPTNRTATFTATTGSKSTKVVAKVEFCDNGCPGVPPPTVGSPVSVVVHSWKVTR